MVIYEFCKVFVFVFVSTAINHDMNQNEREFFNLANRQHDVLENERKLAVSDENLRDQNQI